MHQEKADLLQDIYSLTPLQEGILYHHMVDIDSTNYISQDVFLIDDKADEQCIKKSLHFLGQKHSALRTNIIYEKISKPRQIVFKNREIEYEKIDLAVFDEKEQDEKLKKLLKEDLIRRFDLQRDALLRIKYVILSRKKIMVWTLHHILLDGWSSSLLVADFMRYYKELKIGESEAKIASDLENEKNTRAEFGDYVNWIIEQDEEKAVEYWRQLTKDYEHISEIRPMIKPKKTDNQVERVELFLSEKLTQKLSELAKRHNVTISNISEAAWGIVLQKYTKTDDVIFGKVVSGREAPLNGIEKMVGLCINTIPVRVKSDREMSVEDLIESQKEQALDSKNYEYLSLAKIQNSTNQKSELIKTLYVFENYYKDDVNIKADENSISMTLVKTQNQTNYMLTVNVAIREKKLRLAIKYDPNMFCKDEVIGILEHYKKTLEVMLLVPQIKADEIELIMEEERNKILGEFNDTQVEYPKDKTVIDLFEEQVQRTPNNIAVIYDESKITYAELNQKSNQLARKLRELGVKPNDFVAILSERSIEMMIGLYGIMKAGGAYVPIDPGFPVERIQYMLEDCKAKAVLVYKAEIDTKLPVIYLCDKEIYTGESKNLQKVNKPEDLIYCIYTSGTTGKPKGVPVRYCNVISLLLWYKDRFRITEKERVILITSLNFDLTQRSIFSPHLAGATLFACGNGREYDVWKITDYISKMNISMLSCAASMFYSLLYINEQNGFQKLKSLRKLFLGGEALLYVKIENFLKNHPDIKITNVYGATEDSGCVTSYTISEIDENHSIVPIGKPISNKKIFIFDGNKMCGIGVVGEICICGEGVTNGYLNYSKLTVEKFVKNPYGEDMMYRTGDLGRWLPDGNIECLGRLDEQVKIRGIRIELGEIESMLRKIEHVKDCAVIAREVKDGDTAIYAYIVSEQEISVSEVRDTLGKSLPNYMIPTFIGQIETIPITRNGKLDRQSLPELALKSEKEYIEPRTKDEITVVDVIEKVLGLEKIGMNDDIFEFGANSINIMLIVNRLNQIGCKVNIKTILKSKSVYEIVRGLNKGMKIKYRTM
ncbi:hypothetical protein BVG16_32030 [Paenibacillus selenitireducens]|uniref:Carrier domain-containing protein n=1 Tax=Paenibacillus selenitireducens TaxID=1324314 RepID=A0A1T2WYX1_9BACL|nr:non-ribosomal peptide synthetase [Paenibacillus selenitireducens]OPA72812.1 hypothetical protein BVG16_32030 [Paenibacillus selenitireducens]